MIFKDVPILIALWFLGQIKMTECKYNTKELWFKSYSVKVINVRNMNMQVNKPSTALVEKKAKFLVSRGFSWVNSAPRLCGSDSPVRDELSTLKPRDSIIRISAGIRSPNFTSTTSPNTMSSARSVNFSPSRSTVANCGKEQYCKLKIICTLCKCI